MAKLHAEVRSREADVARLRERERAMNCSNTDNVAGAFRDGRELGHLEGEAGCLDRESWRRAVNCCETSKVMEEVGKKYNVEIIAPTASRGLDEGY